MIKFQALVYFATLLSIGTCDPSLGEFNKVSSRDNNEMAEQRCKGRCEDLVNKCGNVIYCGGQEFDVSKHCPDTCNVDNNYLAEKICKGRCEHLANSCGKTIGCGGEQFDVSKHCPVTCNVDNNDLAEKICKGRCEHLANSCGKTIGCGGEQFDVSKHCPVTCNVVFEHSEEGRGDGTVEASRSGTVDRSATAYTLLGDGACGPRNTYTTKLTFDECTEWCNTESSCTGVSWGANNKHCGLHKKATPSEPVVYSWTTPYQCFVKDNNGLAEKTCKGRCEHLANSCGKSLGCGGEQFDVSRHCPVTCNAAKIDCEDKDAYCPTYVYYYGDMLCEDTAENQWFLDNSGRYGCRLSCKLC